MVWNDQWSNMAIFYTFLLLASACQLISLIDMVAPYHLKLTSRPCPNLTPFQRFQSCALVNVAQWTTASRARITQEISKTVPQRHESVKSFGWWLKISETIAKNSERLTVWIITLESTMLRIVWRMFEAFEHTHTHEKETTHLRTLASHCIWWNCQVHP